MKLRTKLSAAEIEERREEIIELLSERAEIDQAKKEAAKEYREKLKILDKRIEGLRAEAAEGYDLREVEVDETAAGASVTLFRTDTGEVVSSRRMTESERAARGARDAVLPSNDEEPGEGDEDAPEGRQAPRRGRRTRTQAETGRTRSEEDQSDPWAELEERARGSE